MAQALVQPPALTFTADHSPTDVTAVIGEIENPGQKQFTWLPVQYLAKFVTRDIAPLRAVS
jgi:hypothetical protein